MNLPETLEFEYLHLIEENEIKVKDLPKEITDQIKAINLSYSRYKNKPTEKIKNALELQDATVAKEILDFIEKDLPDEPLEEPTVEPVTVADAEPVAEPVVEPVVAQAPAEPVVAVTEPVVEPVLDDKEKQIMEKINSSPEKTITRGDLEKILGQRASEPHQKVGDLVLTKLFMRPLYKIK